MIQSSVFSNQFLNKTVKLFWNIKQDYLNGSLTMHIHSCPVPQHAQSNEILSRHCICCQNTRGIWLVVVAKFFDMIVFDNVNSFLANIPILYPLKTPENFKGYKMGKSASIGFIRTTLVGISGNLSFFPQGPGYKSLHLEVYGVMVVQNVVGPYSHEIAFMHIQYLSFVIIEQKKRNFSK